MKRTLWIPVLLSVILLVAAACSPSTTRGTSSGGSTPTVSRVHPFCGDGVCSGRENYTRCPQDCAKGQHGQSSGLPGGVPVSAGKGTQATQEPEATATPTPKAQIAVGSIDATVIVDRDGGFGTCGQGAWSTPHCTNGKNWWGLHLKAVSLSPVLIIPDGQNRWVLTNNPKVLSAHGYDPNDITLKPSGAYKEARYTDYAGDDECHADIQGNYFSARPMATYENGKFVVTFSFDTLPKEHVKGACASAGFEWDVSDLIHDWGAALSGTPTDLTATLTEEDADGLGLYQHTFKVDTNPSPENRDHVQVEVRITCYKPKDKEPNLWIQTPCPWQQ